MAPVIHIVLFKYSPSVSWIELEKHFREFAALRDTCLKNGKPYMISMRMGKNTSWENFHKGMTHAFVLEFKDEEDRDFYLLHDQVHRAFSAKAGPLIEDSVVVDLRDGELFHAPESAEEKKKMSGACHCQSIKFEVNLHEYRHTICHCRTCQLLGGGPFSCNAIVPKDALIIREGKLSVYSYTGASGYGADDVCRCLLTFDRKPVLCFHCGNCTSHIYHQAMSSPDNVIVRTLLLEGGDKMGVGGEIFSEGTSSPDRF